MKWDGKTMEKGRVYRIESLERESKKKAVVEKIEKKRKESLRGEIEFNKVLYEFIINSFEA